MLSRQSGPLPAPAHPSARTVSLGHAQVAPEVVVSQHPVLGDILTDADGNTLYLFTIDERNVSNCSGGCAGAWPPLLTDTDPVAGDGVSADDLGTIIRADDSTQVTYNGWPLYYFANDNSPGDANGQDFDDVWYVVSTAGGPIQTSAVVNVGEHSELGTILLDRSGRSLYLFTPDERNVSNCAGLCALAWPPLLTVNDPVGGEGLSADHVGTITRADGSAQVTYNGWPLYYFAFDNRPGDTNGQDSFDVWYVLSTDGGPIQTNALVNVGEHSELGTILLDRSGRTLYLFTPDERNVSNCAGLCALAWPPLLTVNDPVGGEGLSADHVGTITRADGSAQVTYNGWPLYYFAFDNRPGDTNGQDSFDVWYVLSTDGGPIQTNALVNVGEHSELGTILLDRSGRTLYLFTPDERNVSNCAGLCALAWPPLLTVNDPVGGEGLSADHVGTITRADGSAQVTYNGWPLYYFAGQL